MYGLDTYTCQCVAAYTGTRCETGDLLRVLIITSLLPKYSLIIIIIGTVNP